MSLTAKAIASLNRMFKITREVGLGTEIAAAQTVGAANTAAIALRGVVFIKALVSGEIDTGVATVDTGIVWTKFAGVMVVAADGTVRVITNVKAVAGAGNTTKIAITATGVVATDTVKVVLI